MTPSPSIFQHSFVSPAARSWYFESPGERRAYYSHGSMHISLSLFLFPFLLLSACVFLAFSYSQSWAFTLLACSTETFLYHLHLAELTFLIYNSNPQLCVSLRSSLCSFPYPPSFSHYSASSPVQSAGTWRMATCLLYEFVSRTGKILHG